jgi:hypothetical protein
MTPHNIKNFTAVLAPPKNWDEAKGPCAHLPIRLTMDGVMESAWKPSMDELEILNKGGVVILGILGIHPAVCLTVEEG